MAEDATLTLLARVVDGLKSIGQQAPGAPLKADDWNRLVAAIGDLAGIIVARTGADRAQLEKGFAPARHDHDGAVLLSWFDAPTRALVERAASGSVEQSVAISRLGGELKTLAQQVSGLSQTLQSLQAAIDGVKDLDEARGRQVERVQSDVETTRGLESRIGQIAADMQGFDATRRDLLAFRDSLTDSSGQPIDLQALRDQATVVEDLRSRLTLADGKLVSLRDFERQLARLETRATESRTGIREIVRDALADPSVFDTTTLADRIAGTVRADIDPRLVDFEDRLGTLGPRLEVTAEHVEVLRGSFNGVEGRVGALAGRVEGLAAVEGRVAGLGQRVSAVEGVANSARADIAGLAAIDGRVRGLEDKNRTMAERLTAELGRVDTRLQTVNTDLERIGRTGGPDGIVEARLSTLDDRLAALQAVETRLSEVQQELRQQNELLAGTRAELSAIGDQRATINQLQAGLSALQLSRAATDSQLQNVLQRQNELDRLSTSLPSPRNSDRIGPIGGIGRVIR